MHQVKNEPVSDGMGDEDGENDDIMEDYEQERLRNIRRNEEMMEKLGLAGQPNRYGDMRSVVSEAKTYPWICSITERLFAYLVAIPLENGET